MGTQQMLLIVIGVIIVGICIIVGALPTFQQGMHNSNRDAIMQDCLRIAVAAQGYFRSPKIFEGGGRSFQGISMKKIGFNQDNDGRTRNYNGSYSIDGSAGTTCEIIGYSDIVTGATITLTVHVGAVDDPVIVGW